MFVCANAGLAQAQKENDPKPGRVTGAVVQSKSGASVRKALVLLRGNPNSSAAVGTLTNASGEFTFRNLDPGLYTLEVEKDGWVAARDSKALTATVTAGQTAPAVTLKLLKAATISGRVVDGDGDPLHGVSIQLVPEPAKKRGGPIVGASSDDRGEYRAYNVRPGQYRICATYSGREQRMDVQMQPAIKTAYPTICFPGTPQAAVFTVEPGAEVQGIDFQIIPARAVTVRGRVISQGAEKPLLTMVSLQPASGGPVDGSVPEPVLPDAADKFELQGVLPGRYRLTVMGASPGAENRFVSSKMIEVADDDLDGVEITVAPPRKIQGKLVVPEGRKVPPLMVVLAPREQGYSEAGGMAQVSSTGAFGLPLVGGGEYDVMLESTGPGDDLYVSAIRLGDSDALADGVRSDVPGDLEIVLKEHGGTLNCSVTGDKDESVPAAHVVLLPDPPKERQLALMGECRTDASGACAILGITPGEYHVYAFPTQVEIDQRDQNTMKAYEQYGKAVKIGEGERRDLDLKAVPVE